MQGGLELLPGGAAANNILVGAGAQCSCGQRLLPSLHLCIAFPEPPPLAQPAVLTHPSLLLRSPPVWQAPKVVEALLGTRFRGRDFNCTPLVAASRNTLAIDADGNVITWVGGWAGWRVRGARRCPGRMCCPAAGCSFCHTRQMQRAHVEQAPVPTAAAPGLECTRHAWPRPS